MPLVKRIISLFFALIFLISGVFHFLKPNIFLEIMPPWLPMKEALIFISGLLELTAAFLLFSKKFRSLGAGFALFLLISFFPVHIQHVIDGGSQTPHFQFGPLISWIRLIFQVIFLYCLWIILNSGKTQSEGERSDF